MHKDYSLHKQDNGEIVVIKKKKRKANKNGKKSIKFKDRNKFKKNKK